MYGAALAIIQFWGWAGRAAARARAGWAEWANVADRYSLNLIILAELAE